MLLSMTGFGEAHQQRGGVAVAVEVRTINSRYFKLTLRCAEGYNALEPDIEQVVRQHIKRGTLQVQLRVDRPRSADEFRVNLPVLQGYARQLQALRSEHGPAAPLAWEQLMLLPGVVDENSAASDSATEDWPLIQETLSTALQHLAQMRRQEGDVMARDMLAHTRLMAEQLEQVEKRAPQVVESYRTRLEERVRTLLAEQNVSLQPADLIREVGIFADRSDISEEIVRLRSHIGQFSAVMQESESSGRKLEFLLQEMQRETNTIGSKANDLSISRHVIEIKAAIEKIREMIQNVE